MAIYSVIVTGKTTSFVGAAELKKKKKKYFRKVLQEYGPFPQFCQSFVDRIVANAWMDQIPNHLLVNEYNLGQGIMPHIGKKN